jgi:hypothetical protein
VRKGGEEIVSFFLKKKKEYSLPHSHAMDESGICTYIYGCSYGAERLTIDAVSLLYNSVRASISWHNT